MTWMPLYDKLIVRRAPAVEASPGGVVVPDAHRKAQNIGTVVTAGAGRLVAGNGGALVPLTIKVGMTVLFQSFAGVPIADNDPNLVLLREDEILAYGQD